MDILTFLTKIIGSVAWPFSLLIIFFIFRKLLVNLIPSLGQVKYKDIELNFVRNLKDAEVAASKSSLPPAEILKQRPDLLIRINKLSNLALNSPRLAIIQAWDELETYIGKKLVKENILVPKEVGEDFLLGESDVEHYFKDDANSVRVVNKLIALKNQTDNYPNYVPTPNDAVTFIHLTFQLIAKLEKNDT